jgi:hypothetical protein
MKIIDALATIHNPDAGINIEEMLPGGSHPARVRLLKEGNDCFSGWHGVFKTQTKKTSSFSIV